MQLQKQKLINYAELETPLIVIEQILNDFDVEEQQLILKNINQRFNSKIQQRQAKDMMGSMDFMSFFNKYNKEQ